MASWSLRIIKYAHFCLPGADRSMSERLVMLLTASIGGDIYRNIDGRLPESPGRVWYEADFDYMGGFRNNRIIYPNDGLVFVTHDHYLTFSEVYWEDNYDDLYD